MTTTGGTQVERLVRYLRSHPGASAADIVDDLRIMKYTSRISDARDQGVDIECFRRDDGRNGYRVVEKPVQQVLFETVTG